MPCRKQTTDFSRALKYGQNPQNMANTVCTVRNKGVYSTERTILDSFNPKSLQEFYENSHLKPRICTHNTHTHTHTLTHTHRVQCAVFSRIYYSLLQVVKACAGRASSPPTATRAGVPRSWMGAMTVAP